MGCTATLQTYFLAAPRCPSEAHGSSGPGYPLQVRPHTTLHTSGFSLLSLAEGLSTSRKIILFVFILLAKTNQSVGQFVIVPIQKENSAKKTTAQRTKKTDPIFLPFWDDFSSVRNGKPKSTLWEYGESAWVNDGMGINPPSLNVATFDGLDSLGKPYSVNDVLAKGYADKMVSAPIRMDLVNEADRSRVFISFFYQFHGNGEPPDLGDILALSFKNSTGGWETIWTKENDGTLAKDKFEQLTIPITADRFYHDNFQFRIRNFARLSGPYDTWHVDYIYISNGKAQTVRVLPLFPDRSITSKLTSPFSTYWSMPIKHYLSNIATNSVKPSLVITNLRADQIPGNGQPVSYSSSAQISTNKKGQPPSIVNLPLDINLNIGSELLYQQQRTVTLNTMPGPLAFDPTADSIHIKLGVIFDSGDNKTKTLTEGDYDFNVFSPIEFRTNDSITTQYILSNYYAYDDGTAEYGAGLNAAGAQLAYQFDMKTDQPDTIVAVDIYFPRFGDDSNQVIQFQILRALTTSPSDILYQASLPVQRNTFNKFWRIKLIDQPAAVKGKFFIGWKQNSSAVIAVGLDKNTDSGNKLFANLNGTWEPNTSIKGSLMIRPVFGRGKGTGGPITSAAKDQVNEISIYPNPSHGVFYIAGITGPVEMYDTTGRKISIELEAENGRTKITILQPNAGIYLLRALQQNRWVNKKVVVK
jgi:Secretion system C-terminal sorting domain